MENSATSTMNTSPVVGVELVAPGLQLGLANHSHSLPLMSAAAAS